MSARPPHDACKTRAQVFPRNRCARSIFSQRLVGAGDQDWANHITVPKIDKTPSDTRSGPSTSRYQQIVNPILNRRRPEKEDIFRGCPSVNRLRRRRRRSSAKTSNVQPASVRYSLSNAYSCKPRTDLARLHGTAPDIQRCPSEQGGQAVTGPARIASIPLFITCPRFGLSASAGSYARHFRRLPDRRYRHVTSSVELRPEDGKRLPVRTPGLKSRKWWKLAHLAPLRAG